MRSCSHASTLTFTHTHTHTHTHIYITHTYIYTQYILVYILLVFYVGWCIACLYYKYMEICRTLKKVFLCLRLLIILVFWTTATLAIFTVLTPVTPCTFLYMCRVSAEPSNFMYFSEDRWSRLLLSSVNFNNTTYCYVAKDLTFAPLQLWGVRGWSWCIRNVMNCY